MSLVEQLKKTVRANRLYNDLPKEDFLKEISFRSSYGKDMRGLTVNEEFIKSVRTDIPDISEKIGDKLSELQMPYIIGYMRDFEDIITRNTEANANTAVRGIITIRLTVWDYLEKYPEWYKVVDLRKGTKDDRGYRGVKLYYQLDGYHYPIEIQLDTQHDHICNSWINHPLHQGESDEWFRGLRKAYDEHTIISAEDYKRRVQKNEI